MAETRVSHHQVNTRDFRRRQLVLKRKTLGFWRRTRRLMRSENTAARSLRAAMMITRGMARRLHKENTRLWEENDCLKKENTYCNEEARRLCQSIVEKLKGLGCDPALSANTHAYDLSGSKRPDLSILIAIDQLEQEKVHLKEECTSLTAQVRRLQRLNTRLENELKYHIMTRNITIADIKKQTPVIIIGEPTLKEAATKYIEQTEYALFTLPKKMTDCSEQKIRQFCSIVFQEAYDICKCHLLKEFQIKLETLVTFPADRGLESCLSAEEEESYSDLQRAYGLLLSACKMKERLAPIDQVARKVKLRYQTSGLPELHFSSVIDNAVSIAWKLLTLLPPAVLCTPEKFFEEWQSVSDFPDDKYRYFTLRYYRPLMLCHARGPPAVKAMIVKVAASKLTINQESDFEDDEENEYQNGPNDDQNGTNEDQNGVNVDQNEVNEDQNGVNEDQCGEDQNRENEYQNGANEDKNEVNEDQSGEDQNRENEDQNGANEDQNGVNEDQNGANEDQNEANEDQNDEVQCGANEDQTRENEDKNGVNEVQKKSFLSFCF